jgi:hypothetical protein
VDEKLQGVSLTGQILKKHPEVNLMNLPAASGRGIMMDFRFTFRPKGRGIIPKEKLNLKLNKLCLAIKALKQQIKIFWITILLTHIFA